MSHLCKSVGGNICSILQITNDVRDTLSYYEMVKCYSALHKETRHKIKHSLDKVNVAKLSSLMHKYYRYLQVCHTKRAVLITGRVHPGETQASHSVEGVVDFLLGEDERAQELRSKFVFYVIPMLNADGVVHGNQRTNLAGQDMNRCWAEPSALLNPEVFATKKLAEMIQLDSEVEVFCDIHGHFQPVGSFMFCNSYDRGSGVVPEDLQSSANLRIIPYFLTQLNNHFKIRNTTFSLEQYKVSCSRQVLFSELKIQQSFTLENSFFKKLKNKKTEPTEENEQPQRA